MPLGLFKNSYIFNISKYKKLSGASLAGAQRIGKNRLHSSGGHVVPSEKKTPGEVGEKSKPELRWAPSFARASATSFRGTFECPRTQYSRME